MNSMINNYALELKDKDGKPTGHFFLDKGAAQGVCEEVLKNNSHWNAGKADKWIASNFLSTWEHFDVNNDGIVEVERMPQFLRYFTGDALDIDLQ